MGPDSNQVYQQIPLWKDVSLAEWTDFKWQMRNRLTEVEKLRQVLQLTPGEEAAVTRREGRFIMSVPPYWASLMDREDPHCPIRRQGVPLADEYETSSNDMVDPLAEDAHMPVPGLVHRYPDRVLLLVTEICAMYCRHCTRSRVVGTEAGFAQPARLEQAYDYLRANKKIRDVLISGGDPLTLSDNKLDDILTHLRAIPHIEFIRIGSRTPVTLPFRVTESLTAVLKKHKPVWMSLHFNHPKEVTPQIAQACDMLADSGVPLGCQTVLLKGINDKPSIMKKLFHELLKIRVRPYYIYQCDPVKGTSHFRTPISTGINIIEKLRGYTTGYAIPTYVVDAPGGGGKIPVNPDYVVSHSKGVWVFRNYAGKLYTYREEVERPSEEAQKPVTLEPSYSLMT